MYADQYCIGMYAGHCTGHKNCSLKDRFSKDDLLGVSKGVVLEQYLNAKTPQDFVLPLFFEGQAPQVAKVESKLQSEFGGQVKVTSLLVTSASLLVARCITTSNKTTSSKVHRY